MLTIAHVARQVGVQPSAIRYYEAQGILRPADRRPNGYRVFTEDTVRRAQALGITLKEIKPLLNLAIQGQQPCKHVKELARNHLRDINNKIRELQSLRSELRTLTRRKAGRPHGNEVCPLIQGA